MSAEANAFARFIFNMTAEAMYWLFEHVLGLGLTRAHHLFS